jgi:tyrosinase
MNDPKFSGTAQAPEFGGIETDPLFSHSGNTNGDLENQPHNYVHGLVGGFIQNSDPNQWQNNGLMSMPPTAALDPIFWLHHCNIDRLWEGWNTMGNVNPTDPAWLQGPAGSGERAFVMPMPDGTEWTYTPSDVVDIAALGYSYDVLPAAPAPQPSVFLRRLRAAPVEEGNAAMTDRKTETELVGASESRISLARRTKVPVRMDSEGADKVQEGFAAALRSAAPARPGRVFLNLENVRGAADSMTYKVYVNVPEGENAEDHPERLAGTIGLFGISRATESDGPHGGNGVSFSLDITRVLGDLHLEEDFDPSALQVELVPRNESGVEPDVTVDRVSIYREAV